MSLFLATQHHIEYLLKMLVQYILVKSFNPFEICKCNLNFNESSNYLKTSLNLYIIISLQKKKRQNDREVEQHRQRYREVERRADKSHRDLKSSLGEKEMKTLLNQSRVNKAKEYTLHVNV